MEPSQLPEILRNPGEQVLPSGSYPFPTRCLSLDLRPVGWFSACNSSFCWGKEPSMFVCFCPISVLKCFVKRVQVTEMHFPFQIKASRR